MHVILTVIGLAVHALALYGWGRAFERSVKLGTDNPALSVALGMACVIAVGGICNLAGIAYAPSLWVITGIGLLLAALTLRPRFAQPRAARASPLATSFALLCAALVCVFVVSSLVPPWAFNYHDDYQKYFAHPARMLQTGSLRGSSASALGFETLGGQAFLHAFALNWGSFDALNAVDLGFALPLCIGLAGIGPCADRLQLAARILAPCSLLILDPQVVNVSATYTASALYLGFIELGRSQWQLRSARVEGYAWASGLLLAALCALKTTFVLLSGVLCVLSFGALLAHAGRRAALRWAGIAAGGFALTLIPWLALHLPTYLAGLAQPPLRVLDTLATPYRVNPLSLAGDLYGGENFASYTFGLSVCALVALYAFRRSPVRQGDRAGRPPWPAYLMVVVAACAIISLLTLLYVVAPRSQGAVTIMRLYAPIFIASVPGLLLGAAHLTRANDARERLAPLLMAVAICLPFVPGAATRAAQAARYGSILAFPDLAKDRNYLLYNHDVLYGSFERLAKRAQSAVPVGAALVAITNAPFWLDYARNPIADVEPAGLATPYSAVPVGSYVIWELNGFATIQPHVYAKERDRPGLLQARIGDAGLRLTAVMIRLARTARVLYADGRTLVLKLDSPTRLRDAYAATSPTR